MEFKLIQEEKGNKDFFWLMLGEEKLGGACLLSSKSVSPVDKHRPNESLNKNLACIMGFYIIVEHRKKGYATILTKLLIEKAKQKGYDGIMLGVDLNNLPAIKSYSNAGFKECKSDGYKFMIYLNS